MLSCTACFRKALQNLSADLVPYHVPAVRSPQIHPSIIQTSSRSHATLRSIRKGHHRHLLLKGLRSSKKPRVSESQEHPRKTSKRAAALVKDQLAREHNRARLLGASSAPAGLTDRLSHGESILADRLKLAEAVLQKLKQEQLLDALALVRASEKPVAGRAPVNGVVSWNHIIDWLMMKRDTGQAWKVFNEMKKRGHKPDAQTFTILLRGYRENIRQPNTVKNAMTVYNSIFAPNSSVTPSIIHTNAILAVCADAHDLDQLWSIAGRLPDRGAGAPDRVTYSTILHAISAEVRHRAVVLGSKEQRLPLAQRSFDPDKIFDQAVDDGRRVWTDVTARWRRGDLDMDASLVCAMGRLLMLSSQRRHHQEVFSLVEQTMNIGSTDEKVASLQRRLALEAGSHGDPSTSTVDDGTASKQSPGEGFTDPFALATPSTSRETGVLTTPTSSVYASPNNNALAMLIESATSLKDIPAGKRYWHALTSTEGAYRLKPDPGCILAYLRLLRVSRSSEETLDLLSSIPEKPWDSKLATKATFIIAMSTCVRDKNNPNVFRTASRLVDLMEDILGSRPSKIEDLGSQNQQLSENVSIKVLTSYMRLAMATTTGLNGEKLVANKTTGDLNFERDPSKNNTLRALHRLGPMTINVKQLMRTYASEYEQQLSTRSRTPRVGRLLRQKASVSESMTELSDYLATLVSAYDKLLMINEQLEDEGMGPLDGDTLKDINVQKRKLSAFITKVNTLPGMNMGSASPQHDPDSLDQHPRGRESQKSGVSAQHDEPVESDARADVIKTIEQNRVDTDSKKDLRGLSRRQKHEFHKETYRRVQFSADSAPPPKEAARRAPRPVRREDRSSGLDALMSASREQDMKKGTRNQKGPVTSFMRQKLAQYAPTKPPRAPRSAGRPTRGRSTGLPTFSRGWGGGFEELARKQGQSASGFLDLHKST